MNIENVYLLCKGFQKNPLEAVVERENMERALRRYRATREFRVWTVCAWETCVAIAEVYPDSS